ncbi:hypothetical protein CHUAL_011647 [Chamberlinius hualienensis]
MKSRIVIFVLIISLSYTLADSDQQQWEAFRQKFNKKYVNVQEETLRRVTFQQNLKLIKEHNNLYDQGKSTFKMGVTQFADLSEKEYKDTLKPILPNKPSNGYKTYKVSSQAAPDSIDWRDYGYVTPVKNQGQCGSVQSFTITGAVEGAHAAATGNLASLSELNIDYCSIPVGTSCSGSLKTVAETYNYIINFNGQDAEGCFTQYNSEKCFSDTSCKAATISYYTDVPSGDEAALKESCGNNGPVATFIDASHISFQLYVAGIYSEPACSSTQLDHGVLIVGYGTEGTNDYWICKNSWGTSWGEQGYIKMSRNQNNQCGIATSASWPTA